MPRSKILLPFLLLVVSLRAEAPMRGEFRGTRVEWARLKTDQPYWDRHADFDRVFLDFLRANTSLDIDPVAHAVSALSLDELCVCPFIFAANVEDLDAEERHNLGEYLRRGGFVLMDLCLEPKVHPDLRASVQNEIRILYSEFPRLKVEALKPDHEIFSDYFELTERRLAQQNANEPGESEGKSKRHRGPLAAAYDGDRMIALISIDGLECDLAGFERFESPTGAAQMMTNIYIYALTGNRTRPSPPSP